MTYDPAAEGAAAAARDNAKDPRRRSFTLTLSSPTGEVLETWPLPGPDGLGIYRAADVPTPREIFKVVDDALDQPPVEGRICKSPKCRQRFLPRYTTCVYCCHGCARQGVGLPRREPAPDQPPAVDLDALRRALRSTRKHGLNMGPMAASALEPLVDLVESQGSRLRRLTGEHAAALELLDATRREALAAAKTTDLRISRLLDAVQGQAGDIAELRRQWFDHDPRLEALERNAERRELHEGWIAELRCGAKLAEARADAQAAKIAELDEAVAEHVRWIEDRRVAEIGHLAPAGTDRTIAKLGERLRALEIAHAREHGRWWIEGTPEGHRWRLGDLGVTDEDTAAAMQIGDRQVFRADASEARASRSRRSWPEYSYSSETITVRRVS